MESSSDASGGETWPAVRREQRPWTTNPDQRGPGGARPNRADRMLESIEVEIPSPIARRQVLLSAETVVVCEAAVGAVTVLEAGSPGLGGLGDLMVRSEAVASSRIERVYADLGDLARASIGERASEAARRTVAAMRALGDLAATVDGHAPLTEAAVLQAHRDLLQGDPFEGPTAGTYRRQQNWIGGSDTTPRGAVHVPPPHELVGELMTDLVAFANRDDLSVLAQAAVVHGQFEAIHPFADGNGRIGRGLISAVLRRRGLSRSVVVPVAAAMLADVDTYFDRLADYRSGDPDALVAYLARATLVAAEAAAESAEVLRGMPGEWRDRVPARRGSAARSLLDQLAHQPVLDVALVERLTGVSRPRAYQAIDRLVEGDVLEEITGAGRNRIWVASDVLGELSALEQRIGVRATPSSRWR